MQEAHQRMVATGCKRKGTAHRFNRHHYPSLGRKTTQEYKNFKGLKKKSPGQYDEYRTDYQHACRSHCPNHLLSFQPYFIKSRNMKKMGIFYGSTTGTTKTIGELLIDENNEPGKTESRIQNWTNQVKQEI